MIQAQKTTLIKNSEIKRNWHELDASQYPLGRLATRVATLLTGKHKPAYSGHQDLGDFVVVVNADKVKFSSRARKLTGKTYHRYSGYPGGIKSRTLAEQLEAEPEKVVREAVRGMLDDNRLRKLRLRRLKVVQGSKHEFPVVKPQ